MDSSSCSPPPSSSSSLQALSTSASSPRSRELQGPRPAPLRVRKDSHKVRKPPIAPQPNTNTTTSFQQHRTTPLIIYTVSPKVIHTNPEDFMTLVQRLTGADNNTQGASSSSSSTTISGGGGLFSSAARYAVMDKINTYQQTLTSAGGGGCTQDDVILGSSSTASTSVHLERSSSNMQFVPSGILSPGPASLAPNNFLFSPLSSDPNSMSNFFQGLSPMMNHNQNVISKEIISFNGISSIPSPGTNNLFLSPSIIFSPTIYSLDLFNNFGDHL